MAPAAASVAARTKNALSSVPSNSRIIECAQVDEIADRILRCDQRGLKADRTRNFADKIVAVVHDQLVLRPSLAKTADLAHNSKIRRLADCNAKLCIRPS